MKKLCYGELTNTAHISNIVVADPAVGRKKRSPGVIMPALEMAVLVKNNLL